MKFSLGIALVLNLAICCLEICAFRKLRKKTDIWKYYTFLQNFLALLASAVCAVSLALHLGFGCPIPELARGLRYIAACGLAAAGLTYGAFLARDGRNQLTSEDFLPGLRPKTADLLLHCVCPLISLLSFLVFERRMPLSGGIWTTLAPIPSCAYWIVYGILSAGGFWDEPYDFTPPAGKKQLPGFLVVMLIPLSFIGISFLLWTFK